MNRAEVRLYHPWFCYACTGDDDLTFISASITQTGKGKSGKGKSGKAEGKSGKAVAANEAPVIDEEIIIVGKNVEAPVVLEEPAKKAGKSRRIRK